MHARCVNQPSLSDEQTLYLFGREGVLYAAGRVAFPLFVSVSCGGTDEVCGNFNRVGARKAIFFGRFKYCFRYFYLLQQVQGAPSCELGGIACLNDLHSHISQQKTATLNKIYKKPERPVATEHLWNPRFLLLLSSNFEFSFRALVVLLFVLVVAKRGTNFSTNDKHLLFSLLTLISLLLLKVFS